MFPDKQKMRFRDARGAAQAEGQEPEQEFSRTPEPQEAPPEAPQESTGAPEAPMEQGAPEGEAPMEGQAELQQRLQGYNGSASPGRGIDLNDPELLKFILLKLLESGTGGQEEAAEQPPTPQGGQY